MHQGATPSRNDLMLKDARVTKDTEVQKSGVAPQVTVIKRDTERPNGTRMKQHGVISQYVAVQQGAVLAYEVVG